MKLRQILPTSLLVIGLLFSTVSAQIEPPKGTGDINPPVSQCSDGFDNDSDSLIDINGGVIDNQKVGKDPQCTAGVKCEDGTDRCTKQTTTTNSSSAPASGASDFKLQVRINNPLKVDTIEGAIQLFMSMVLRIAIPFIIVFFIWSGLSFILARGNPEKIKTAKKMFWYTIIGTLLILGAWTITNAIIGTVNSITG